MTDPAQGIRDLLVTAGVGIFNAITGDSIHISREPPAPDTVVTIYNTGGDAPDPKFLLDFPKVQVRVRGAPNGYQDAYVKCIEVRDALLGIPDQTINGDLWGGILGVGGINSLGYDESQRPIFTQNFRMFVEPSAGTHRIPM